MDKLRTLDKLSLAMSRPSRSIIDALTDWIRKILAPAMAVLSKSGKIIQTLWDAAQLQKQQRDNLIHLGHHAAQLIKQGKIQDIQMERLVAKIEQAERILERQELILRSYQTRGDLKQILRTAESATEDRLEPI